MTKIDTTVPADRISHWIETRPWKKVNEELFFYFETEWRGEKAFAQIHADRYTSSDHEWTDWRIVCREAKKENWGGYHSDTARARFTEAFKPVVIAWLNSAEYDASRKVAFKNLACRVVSEMESNRDIPRVYEFLHIHADEFDEKFVDAIDNACIAFDEYQRQVKKLESI